jgi:hypothetical protein
MGEGVVKAGLAARSVKEVGEKETKLRIDENHPIMHLNKRKLTMT